MDCLPNEVIIYIFQHIPQRYIPILSTVCQRWKIILYQPLFFNTLDIYSIQQLNKFIEIGKTKTKNSNILVGYLVKHMYFYTQYPIYKSVLVAMIDSFPNFHSIQGSFVVANNSPLFFKRLNYLEHIPYWYQKYDTNWMGIINNHPQKIKSLEFTITPPSASEISQSLLNKTHFIPNTTIKTSLSNYNDYYIHNINLPKLLSLTYLSMDWLNIDGDERLFESLHEACPQLTSLTFKSLNMLISDDYDYFIANSLIQPNTCLKELSIGKNIHNPKFYDYLSFKYPYLESFSLTIKSRSYSPTSIPFFRVAIYNVITRYKYLKKLITKLDCEEFQVRVWPQSELFHWLQHNPTQLTHLDYTYIFIHDVIFNRVDFGRTLPQLTPSRSSTNFFNGIIFIQPHDYLNHLTSLSLGNEPFNAIDILYYFYLCNKATNTLSKSIEELKLQTSVFGSLYVWLNAFPNLKSLSIIGSNILSNIINENDIDINDDDVEYYENDDLEIHSKEIYDFFKKKKSWMHQAHSDSTVITNSNHDIDNSSNNHIKHEHHHKYKLNRIEMANCRIRFQKYGWNGFFKHFTDLKTIILYNINPVHIISYNHQSIKEPVQQATFDLSHLSLDLMNLKNFNYDQYTIKIPPYNHYVKELIINETSCNNTYYVGYGNEHKYNLFDYKNSTTLNIICKSIDNIVFDQIPYSK
ncbi:unnamed protein product [Cunninghamella blakesleeana]